MWSFLIVISSTISYINAGSVRASENVYLEWSFPDSDTIEFLLEVTFTIIESDGWISFLFKEASDGTDKFNLDGIYIDEGSATIYDSFTMIENKLQTDESLGSPDDLADFTVEDEEEVRIYSWTRLRDTQDTFDIPLVEDSDYYFHYAYGINGETETDEKFRDYVLITLSEDFDVDYTGFLSFNIQN